MRTLCFTIFFILSLFPLFSISQSCNNWLKLNSQPSFVRVGDLDITGDKITVEAIFNRTAPWSGSDLYQGDLVSKHEGPNDCNYLLRPGSAEITTSTGYYKTPPICQIELNKTYHAAMVYDGKTLKFYRNGFLMSQIAATGNLVQNNWQTQIGLYFLQLHPENFIGYLNEVRIWNIVRTQSEIRLFMNQSLPSPQTTPGLLAYYTFDNLLNKQGNSAWNGTLSGGSFINESNQNCNLIVDSCKIFPPQVINVTPDFIVPDTICINTPIEIINTSTNASSFKWNFCVADLKTNPDAVNLGNPGGLSSPVFIDYAFYNNNHYGFLINYKVGRLIRLNFGNSLLNAPTATDLGNFGGIIPPGEGAEGIQMVFNENKWYAIIVGGSPVTGSTPRILKVDFGPDLTNTNPVATNWGNIGNMLQPIDLHVFQEGANWYGLTVNAENNTITRFNFTNSFSNTPSAVNLGNIGNLQYPTGIFAINDNGFWRVFVVNGGDKTTYSNNCSLTRLDFGNSLLNTPNGINLGNPGNKLQHPRDLTIMKFCNQIIGYAVNGNPNHYDIIKMDFGNQLSSIPILTSLGNLGGLKFPHSISKLFQTENDIYGFITNVADNTITRLRFSGCSNSSLPNNISANPPSILYNSPGKYNINLLVDVGLSTQASICKQIVVVPELLHKPLQEKLLCQGDSLKIGSTVSFNQNIYWNTGAVDDSIIVKNPGVYWNEIYNYGCSNRDSFLISVIQTPHINIGEDTSICKGDSIQIKSSGFVDASYSWYPSINMTDSLINNPILFPQFSTKYIVSATMESCTARDTIIIQVRDKPKISLGKDTAICKGDSLVLNAFNNGAIYEWQDLSTSPTFLVKESGNYTVKVLLDGCFTTDSIQVINNPNPKFSILPINSVCEGTLLQIITQTNDDLTFKWFPEVGISNSNIKDPIIKVVSDTITYSAIATNNFKCSSKDSVIVFGLKNPYINLGPDTSLCPNSNIVFNVENPGASYLWNDGSTSHFKTIYTPGIYHINVTKDGCSSYDSIIISLKSKPYFKIIPETISVCEKEMVIIKAEGGEKYEWYSNGINLNNNGSAIQVYPESSMIYSVIINEDQCGYSDTLFSNVGIKPLPIISISKSNDVTCEKPQSQLFASGGIEYKWAPALNLNAMNVSNPIVRPSIDTWYQVTVKGENGCIAKDSIIVFSNFSDGSKFYVPNAFTPNYDGKNDCFGVAYWSPVDIFEFSIFNRWGEKVFFTNKKECWDGIFKGKLQPEGIYVYIINAKGSCGNINKKGTFTLLR